VLKNNIICFTTRDWWPSRYSWRIPGGSRSCVGKETVHTMAQHCLRTVSQVLSGSCSLTLFLALLKFKSKLSLILILSSFKYSDQMCTRPYMASLIFLSQKTKINYVFLYVFSAYTTSIYRNFYCKGIFTVR
jgi:hypothetical protein